MTTHEDVDREAIRAHFIAERGYWRPWTEALLRDNPRFLERYATYAGHPARVGPLSERMVELIYVALDASSTHLFESGLRTHMEKALAAGARPAEIFDVLHAVAAQGLDSAYQAVEILAAECEVGKPEPAGNPTPEAGGVRGPKAAGNTGPEAAGNTGPEAADDPAPDCSDELRARIDRLQVAVDSGALRLLLRLDPGYLPVLLDFLEHGRPEDGLSAPDRSLVEVALHACFTGFDRQALRRRIRRALAAGCTAHELLQAIQLGAHLSVHGAALGAGVFAAQQGSGVRDAAG
jgi:alkylhydroperoxidase/carboxymuconolactone decarboxylase family protein YurZ